MALQLGRFTDAERLLRDALVEPGPTTSELRHLLLLILAQEGKLDLVRQLIEEHWSDSGLSTVERLALVHEHIALDLDAMPLEGNLDFLGASAAGASDDEGLWLTRANLAIKTGRLDEGLRWLDAAQTAPWG